MIAPISLGTLLRQRYLIRQILGQGGFGRTYLATDQERFNERCVLKEFFFTYQDTALLKKSQLLFQREASTLYQLHHPQIPRFWAAFEEGQRLFLVQDFVEGQTYRRLLSDRKSQGLTFTEAEVCHLLKQLLPVLVHIHDRGIVHRDISLENIILKSLHEPSQRKLPIAEAGLPVLIDFGAVKEATSQLSITSAVTRVGKVGYAPPEQLQTGRVYPNSDLYALAATCLVLLTGKEPHSLLDSQSLVWRWQPYATLSNKLTRIFERMLSVYPSDRYQSAQEVWVDLQSVMPQLNPTQLNMNAVNLTQRSRTNQPVATATRGSIQQRGSSKSAAQGHPVRQTTKRLKPSQLRKKNRLWLGMGAAFLLGTGVASSFLWQAKNDQAASHGEVWVSGAKLPHAEASRIIGGQGDLNLALQAVPSANQLVSNSASVKQAASEPQPIQFPPGKLSATVQGTLQQQGVQSYSIKASQGQVLTATLAGSGVIMNLLRSNQDGIDAAAYQTRSWTGQLPTDDQYFIQISGSGAYMLDVATTPISRPTQEIIERVTFARGTNGTTVTGTIAPQQIRRYLLRAKQGQLVLVKKLQGNVSLSAIAPNGQRLDTNTLNPDWKGRLPSDGDYVFELSANQLGDYALSFEIF
ncbi:serine/threonine protein kinase [Phormidium sp. CLA17]|uniref:serine/threonine protein kinase n=1 Tax=Leptolyngbya sp. Cla-17 TaxID=2803751 RepID=UPI0014916027|nr:serine/threonine-protein kinase [Leptolyngbya sp. Cla-17]MBM0740794.1 serine/threonine protein kinase [Leptolyngbya sp. Cla-17]